MKIIVRVVITLILLVCMFLGYAFISGNSDNVRTLEQSSLQLEAASAILGMLGQSEAFGDIPTAADYQRALYVDWVFFVFSFLAIIFPFTRGKIVAYIVTSGLAISAILLYIMQPVLNGTEFQDDNQDKTLALVVMLLGLVAAGLVILYKVKLSKPEEPALQPQPTQPV